MFVAGPAPPPPGGVNSAMFALLMIDTLVCACRYIRLMYWPRWNSPATVVGAPGFGGKSGPSCAGFHGVHALPSSSTPAGLPPDPLKGFRKKPAPVDTDPGPCASARKPCGVFVLERTMCVWSSKTNKFLGGP